MSQPTPEKDLSAMIFNCLEGTATLEQLNELESRLKEDTQAQDIYQELLIIYAILHRSGPHLLATCDGPDETPAPLPSGERVREIERYARQQLEAFLEQQHPESAYQSIYARQRDLADMVQDLFQTAHRWIRIAIRTVKIGFICGILILVGFIIANLIKDRIVVAKLQRTVSARWETAPDKLELRRGWMALEQGCAEIVFEQGAQVIIQAPSRFRLVSKGQMYLKTGTVTAHVPPEAIGFMIETPSSIFEDFGTEFGVIVDASRQSEVHVFKGEVAVATSIREKPLSQNRLKQGQCAITDPMGAIYIDQSHYGAQQFLRELPDPNGIGIPGKRLSLADLVGGGNGYGTGILGGSGMMSADGSINPITGRPNDPYRPAKPGQSESNNGSSDERYDDYHYQCSNDYIRVPKLAYIDGIFVPDGGQGPSVVSSAGHIFQECPDTDGRTKWNATNGWRYRDMPNYSFSFGNEDIAHLKGLSLAANIGITFDLNAIRQTMPGTVITAFDSTAGIPALSEPDDAEVDLWVLVDGEVRFVKQDVRIPTLSRIHVPLNPQDHFLTLVITDSQNPDPVEKNIWSYRDRCFWKDPVLELAPSQSVRSR
jgi:hypothetical protein